MLFVPGRAIPVLFASCIVGLGTSDTAAFDSAQACGEVGKGPGNSEGSGDTSQRVRRNLKCGGGIGGSGRLSLALRRGNAAQAPESGDAFGVAGGSVEWVVVGVPASMDETKPSRRAMCLAC